MAIRPRSRIDSAYHGLLSSIRGDHVVLVRSVHRDGDGVRTVVVRDITNDGPEMLLTQSSRLIVSISMRSLSDDEVRRRWTPLLDATMSTVLIDLSPTRHLRSWLSAPEAGAEYGLGRYTVAGREAVVLGLRVSTPHGQSRLFLAVVSPSFAAAFEVWIAGSPDVTNRVDRDDNLLDQHEPLVAITVGHLITEEAFLNFQAGGPP